MSTITPLTPSVLQSSPVSQWETLINQKLADLRVAMPGIIQSFDPVTQTATVQPAVTEVVRFAAGPQALQMPILSLVPVILPRAGSWAITLPLAEGDECIVIFADMCIDAWWQNGGVQNQIERRRHDLTDCFCIPGPWSQPRVLSNYSTASAQVRSDDGTVVIDFAESGVTMTAPKVQINSTGDIDLTASGKINLSAAQVIAASTDNNTKVDGRIFLNHVHTGVSSGTSDSGPVL